MGLLAPQKHPVKLLQEGQETDGEREREREMACLELELRTVWAVYEPVIS